MSGGSYNYMYYQFEDTYVDKMYDIELDEMMSDLVRLLHDLEWWQSSDYGEEDYRKTVTAFKKKWFGRTEADIHKLIDKEFNNKKDELMKSLGWLDD